MNKKMLVLFPLIAMLLLAACTPAPLTDTNPTSSAVNTQPAATATANIPVTGPTSTPTTADTPTTAPTQAPAQISTPIPTFTPVPTQAPQTVARLCNQAAFVADVTIPDGSLLDPGSTFTKTWRLENTGACSWTTSYALVFDGGSLMGGPTVVSLPNTVNPGETIDLSVDLVAPASAGTYQGDWLLRDANGSLFGVGTNASQPIWANVVVGSSTLFAVTDVQTSANSSSYTGVCPATVAFSASIYANEAGTVTYYWRRSDGSTSAEVTLTYASAGYQTVTDAWTLGANGAVVSAWEQIYIDAPNHQYFNPASANLYCVSATATSTATPTLVPTATRTPSPTSTATPTKPAPTATQPAPTKTPTATQPAPTRTPTATLPAPTRTPTPTQPGVTKTPTPTKTLTH